ncbi:MAG TPA: hypothetical protein VGE31_01575 [Candidatus Paceibacterota bacterium]
MSATLEIDGKILHSIRAAAEATSYSRDYVTRLAREEKIIASQIGRQWYVDLDSLKTYEQSAELEQKNRHQQLSEIRKQERSVHEQLRGEERPLRRVPVVSARVKRSAVSIAALIIMVGTVLHYTDDVLEGSKAAGASLGGLGPAIVSVPAPVTQPVFTKPEFPSVNVTLTKQPQLQNGVLVLPAGTASSSLDDIFSDEAHLISDERGQRFVVRYDEAGRVVEKHPVMFAPEAQ